MRRTVKSDGSSATKTRCNEIRELDGIRLGDSSHSFTSSLASRMIIGSSVDCSIKISWVSEGIDHSYVVVYALCKAMGAISHDKHGSQTHPWRAHD